MGSSAQGEGVSGIARGRDGPICGRGYGVLTHLALIALAFLIGATAVRAQGAARLLEKHAINLAHELYLQHAGNWRMVVTLRECKQDNAAKAIQRLYLDEIAQYAADHGLDRSQVVQLAETINASIRWYMAGYGDMLRAVKPRDPDFCAEALKNSTKYRR